MKKRKGLIIFLSIDLLLIAAFICNDTFGLFKIIEEGINSVFEWITPKPSSITITFPPITTTSSSPDSPSSPSTSPEVDEDYPIKVYFDGMGGNKISGSDYAYLDGENYTIDNLEYPVYEMEEYEFVRWEVEKTKEEESGQFVNVWQYYAIWEYSPVDFYTKLEVSSTFSYSSGSYNLSVVNNVESINLAPHLTYRSEYAVARVYDNPELVGALDIENLELSMGDNVFYLDIDANENGHKTYIFKIHRQNSYNISFNVTGVLETIEGLNDYIAYEGETLSWVKGYLNLEDIKYIYDVNLDAPISSDIVVNIDTSYKVFDITYSGVLDAYNPNPSTYTVGDSIELIDLELQGYTFEGWYLDSEYSTIAEGIGSTDRGDKTFYAKFTINTYTITYELDGGEANNVETYTIKDAVVLEDAFKLGYIFTNWEIYTSESEHTTYNGDFSYLCDLVIKANYKEALDSVFYGKYPQELVTDSNLLNALSFVSVDSNGIYHYNGEEYVRLEAQPFANGLTFTNGQEVERGASYFFKVQPIEWIILYSDDNHYSILSAKVLDAHIFDENTNDYASSAIKDYIDNLLLKLFDDKEERNILSSLVLNDYDNANPDLFDGETEWQYNDFEAKLYLPSYKDINTYLEDMKAMVTDYAIASGIYYNPKTYQAFYFYRSPYASDRNLYVAGYNASNTVQDNSSLLITNKYGIRLVMTVISGPGESDLDEEA